MKTSIRLSKITGISMISLAILFTSFTTVDPITKGKGISKNKQVITRYIDGFNTNDHPKILSCLTNDVVWEMPGVYLHKGKETFDKEINNEAFVGRPTIQILKLIEESDVVIAEGTVRAKRKDGGTLNAVFCDVFEMKNGLIKKLTSYLMVKK